VITYTSSLKTNIRQRNILNDYLEAVYIHHYSIINILSQIPIPFCLLTLQMLNSQVLNHARICLETRPLLQIQEGILTLELKFGSSIGELDGLQSAGDAEHRSETSQKDTNKRFDFDLG
jgi:hypothetical protein